MRLSVVAFTALLGAASAAPNPVAQITANDLSTGACKKVTLIFARASTEMGNMGSSMGPATCSGLKQKFSNNVACQGVGGAYSAGLADNVMPAGTSAGAIAEATKLFNSAASKCPQTVIVAGGYSQGTAVMMNAISKLPENVKSKVAGVVLFGYTKNAQTKSSIPNYPKERVKVLCSSGDGVCGGALMVTMGHFSYMADGSGPQAVNFLTQRINGGGGGGAAAGPAAAMGGGKGAKGGKGAGR